MNYPNNKIALIGIGILGESIAERLIAKGFKLGIWNRTKKKCHTLIMNQIFYNLSFLSD